MEYKDIEKLIYSPEKDVLPSSEYVIYNPFYRQKVLRRISDLKTLHDKNELSEYPIGSIVHLVDDNLMMTKPIVFVPDTEGYAMSRLPLKKFIYHITTPVEQRWAHLQETFILPQTGVNATLLNYRRKNQHFMRTCMKLDEIPNEKRANVQSFISYASLYRARIFGLLRNVRRFNYVMTNVINGIALFPDRLHFIPIPVGTRQFDRSMYLKTFKRYDKVTIRYPDDPWWLFCMHLVGFLHGAKTDSLFEAIPKNMWSKIHFVLYSETKMVILRLDHLKEFNGDKDTILIRFITLLNSLAASSVIPTDTPMQDAPISHDTTVDESLPPAVAADVPFGEEETHAKIISTQKTLSGNTVAHEEPSQIHEEGRDITHTDNIAGRTENEPQSNSSTEVPPPIGKETVKEKLPIVRTTPEVPLADTQRKIDRILDEGSPRRIKAIVSPLTIDDDWLEILPEKITDNTNNAPEFKVERTKEEQEEFEKQTTKKIDTAAEECINRHTELTTAQKQWAEKKSQAYKEVKIGDKTVKEILDKSVDTSINEDHIAGLDNDVVDTSMLDSSISKFGKDYNEKLFTKDMVSVVSSFNKVGMFMTDFKAEDCSDSLNNSTKYKVSYEDINHKKHTINFILPDVDDRGYCYVNGTYKILKKQRVPLPICKVSATRVTLNSDYNKYLVERNTQVAHSFLNYIDRIVSKYPEIISCTLGSHKYPSKLLPYEYTALSSKYSKISINNKAKKDTAWEFNFELEKISEVLDELNLSKDDKETILATQEDAKATWCGYSKATRNALFFELNGTVIIKNLDDDHQTRTTFIDFLSSITDDDSNPLSEWTDFKLLNTTVPTIIALCYRYGLSDILTYTKTAYRLYDKGARFTRKASDVIIKFADKTLVIPRAPLTVSLLFAGLNWVDLKQVQMEQLDSKDIYYDLLGDKGISVHNLKGIDNYFDYFVDPITADVLNQMKEPVDAKGLLVRATQLLATEDHKPAASSTNFRYRSYERINSAIYKVLARAHSTYVNKSVGATHKFSISDYEIKQLITQDQLVENVDFINPINDIKYDAEYSHSGFGGRQSIDTFMVDDRQFPDDGVGIISEATIDSSKTAYAASMTVDPTMVNLRGMTMTRPRKDLKPTQVLSPTAILVPGVTQDDGKRANFVNIHLSHYVNTKVMEPYRVRTGYGKIVAHRTKPPFAYCAEEDGKVLSVDEDTKVLKVQYKSGKCVAVSYGEEYDKNGGGGFYCTQKSVVNGYKANDTVKKGDVLVYNENFFTPDPYSKQVDWNIGATANVAFIEQNHTLDDGNAISASLAEKLAFNPVHVRDVVLKTNTTIHKIANIGDVVKNTDPILMFDTSAMEDDMFGSLGDDSAELLAKLNRQTPKAKFTGKIVKIDAFFKCDTTKLSPSLKKIIDQIQKRFNARAQSAKGSANESTFNHQLQIKYTDRIGITDIDDDTVILRFYIQQDMGMDIGSKLEILSSLKTVCSNISPTDWATDDPNVNVQMMYSEIGVNNRIINSPKICGITAAVMEKLEKDILKDYFGE